MLIWEVRGFEGEAHRCAWLVAMSVVETLDIAGRKNVNAIGEPVKRFPGRGTHVFWRANRRKLEVRRLDKSYPRH